MRLARQCAEGAGIGCARMYGAQAAVGEADLYVRVAPTNEWDTAAGHAVLAAAGGTVTTLDGEPLLYGHAARGFENSPFIAWGKGPLAKRRLPASP